MSELFKDERALYLFLALFVPGFIMLKVYDLRVAGERRDFTKHVFDAVVYSVLNFAALFPLSRILLSLDRQQNDPYGVYLAFLAVFIIAPVLWPNVIYWVRCQRWGTKFLVHPKDKAWDAVFSLRKEAWVIVHLKDGRRIGGWFGSNSFASSSPAPPEIYLEEVWTLSETGEFLSAVPQTMGVLILKEDMIGVEMFSSN